MAVTRDNGVITTNASATTSHTVNTPSGGPGDLLVGAIGSNESSNTWSSSYNQIAQNTGLGNSWYSFWLDDGGESSLTVTSTSSNTSVAMCWRLSGTVDPAVTSEDSASANGSSGVPNPGSVSVTDGPKSGIVLCYGVLDNAENISGAPTSYSNFLSATTSGGDRITGCAADRLMTSISSEDPGAFSGSGDDSWGAHTIFIPEEAAGAGLVYLPYYPVRPNVLLRM